MNNRTFFTLTVVLLLLVVYYCHCSCNGNGVHYPDDPKQVCECYECYTGDQCQIVVDESECVIQDVAGNPLLFQQFWQEHPEVDTKFGVTMDVSYRTSYNVGMLNETLMQTIQKLHEKIGNVAVSGKYIVLGTGGTNLIAASIWAMQTLYHNTRLKREPLNVFARVPYYNGYSNWSNMYPTLTVFNSSLHIADTESILEFVTIPNNPSGELRQAYYKNAQFHVADMVYYWPSLTNTSTMYDHDVMLFSLSKLTGHAGSRFGWAIVRDEQVAKLMNQFISASEIHVSVDTQYRAMNILQYLVQDSNDEFFHYIRDKMTSRWSSVMSLFNTQTSCFSVESVPGQFYLLVKCHKTDTSCFDQFKSVGIVSWAGEGFGLEYGRYTRLEMVVRDSTFQILLQKLKKLISSRCV